MCPQLEKMSCDLLENAKKCYNPPVEVKLEPKIEPKMENIVSSTNKVEHITPEELLFTYTTVSPFFKHSITPYSSLVIS